MSDLPSELSEGAEQSALRLLSRIFDFDRAAHLAASMGYLDVANERCGESLPFVSQLNEVMARASAAGSEAIKVARQKRIANAPEDRRHAEILEGARWRLVGAIGPIESMFRALTLLREGLESADPIAIRAGLSNVSGSTKAADGGVERLTVAMTEFMDAWQGEKSQPREEKEAP